MTPLRTRGFVVVAVLTVLSVLVSGCTGGSDSPSTSKSSSPSARASDPPSSVKPAASLQDYYDQKLTWRKCEDGDECATLRVPLDYAKPTGKAISLALLKVPALDKSDRIGSMVINPGGPGASGVEYAQAAGQVFGEKIRKVYDVVGFDPRGIGKSTPLECLSDKQLDKVTASDPDPDTAAERKESDALLRGMGEGCLRRSGDLVRHMSTVEVARDLDVLRAALGDKKLTYFGASYGTSIGATYANLFPKRVGRMVLDGALDASLGSVKFNLVQAHGFETALRAYVGNCVAKGDCFLGSTVDAGVARIQRFLADVEKKPLRDSQGEVPIGLAYYGINFPLYGKQFWPVLDKALQDAFKGDPQLLRLSAYQYLNRSADGKYKNLFEAFYAVTCLDDDEGIPSSEVGRYEARFLKASPTFGRTFAYSLTACHSWPVHSGVRPKRFYITRAAPIMIVGTTRDPATPLVWAQSLAKQIKHSVLVTRDGDGHTGYRSGSKCTDNAVESYLVDGVVPKKDVSCS